MKLQLNHLYLLALLFAFTSCDEDDLPERNFDPVLMSIEPVRGMAKEVVTIYGRNFSSVKDKNEVNFAGKSATVIEASPTRMQVVAPAGNGETQVEVSVNGTTAGGQTALFTYLEPQKFYKVSTLAGNSDYGLIDGKGIDAYFRNPEGVAMDPDGNLIVVDRTNNSIRKVSQEGEVITLTGNGTKGFVNGTLDQARFNYPWKPAVDQEGNIFVADRDNHVIRKISKDGTVSTYAGNGSSGYKDGSASGAQFYQPIDVAVDQHGVVYVADNINHRIRKITPEGVVSTIAGGEAGYKDGEASVALLQNPSGIAVDKAGNLYVADRKNHRIRKITPEGTVSTVAGNGDQGAEDGPAAAATFNQPYGLDVSADGGMIIVADLNNHKIRMIFGGNVSTVAGSTSGFLDGVGFTARFTSPTDVAISGDWVYVADLGNHRIRKIELK
ncbi:IPT/TIG domain-containing protein [Rapidithrix thailandica]|uniref:IPT/TIG domain-containing protein n=1 Tax=Rapidithrix thailandica TaxID=413964 RepID=A0AAW9S427_9BACT